MAKVIRCECGYFTHGESDDELAAAAERHIESEHPDLVAARIGLATTPASRPAAHG